MSNNINNDLDYSFVFEKEGKYNDIWLAATNEKHFKHKHKKNLDQYRISEICAGIETDILHVQHDRPKKPPKKRRRITVEETQQNSPSAFNLKVASNLMMGAVRIFRQQVNQLYDDSKFVLSKQSEYNAFIRQQTIEDERRKQRVNYTEIFDEGNGSAKPTKKQKKKGNDQIKLTKTDFKKFEENVTTNEHTEVLEDLILNTAQVDQITLRETYLDPKSFPSSIHHEIGFNDFGPLDEEEMKLMFEENMPNIDEVRHEPMEKAPSLTFTEQPITEHHAVQNPTEMPPPEIQIPVIDIPVPTIVEPIESSVQEQQKLVITEPDIPEIVFKLPKLIKKTAKRSKPRQSTGKKRKMLIDTETELTIDQIREQIKNTTDIVRPAKSFPPLKKFRMETPENMLGYSTHTFVSYVSDVFNDVYASKIKFLSLSEKTKKRKLKAVLETDTRSPEEPPSKKLRSSTPKNQQEQERPSDVEILINTDINHDLVPVSHLSDPERPYEPPPILTFTQNPHENSLIPHLDDFLTEFEKENQEPLNTEQGNNGPQVEDIHWKKVKETWGQVALIKKLILIFHNKKMDSTTIEFLIADEWNKKVGTVTFSSLIHLKAKKYLVLEKNDRLEVERIKQGSKMEEILQKMA